MADQKNKNLSIKLSFDVDSAKVIGSFDEIKKGIDLSKSASLQLLDVDKEREKILADATQKTNALEAQKRSLLKELVSNYSTVNNVVNNQNAALNAGTTTVEKASAIIQRQVEEVNKVKEAKLAQLSADLKLLESKKEEVQLQKTQGLQFLDLKTKSAAAYDLIYERILKNTAAIKAFNAEQAASKASAKEAEQDAIATRLQNRTNILKAAYAKQVADSKKSFELANAIALEGENSITVIKLKAKQEQEDITQKFNEKMIKLQKDFVESEKNWTNPSAQIAQAIRQRDQAILDLNVRLKENIALAKEANKEASSGRPSMGGLPDLDRPNVRREAALKQELSTYDRFLTEEQAKLKSSIDIENAMKIHGINSIQVARLQANEQIRQSEVKLQADLENIRKKVAVGSTTSGVTGQVSEAQRAYRAVVDATTVSLNEQEKAAAKTEETHKNLFYRVGLGIIAYRLWNTVLTTVKDTMLSVPKTGIELESTIASLTATTGSAAGMNSVMIALQKEADRTGIQITTLRENFRSFQASTSLAGESIQSTWHMFTNLNTVITGLHLSADKANGIFLAMAQIFNKGKVQSEELVKQLGNLLPGAFASFAEANNKAFGGQFKNSIDLIDQMKKGMVFAHDTVERFTDFMAERFEPAFALASHGLNASIGRLQTSFTLLKESIYESTSGPIVSAINGLTALNNIIIKDINGANNLGRILTVGLGVAIVALVSSTARSTAISIADTAAKIRQAAALSAMSTATTVATVTTREFTLAADLAIVASAGWTRALAFFSSPTTIITGIAMIGVAIAEHIYNGGKAVRDLNDLIAQSKVNLDKVVEKPLSLEMSVNLDPKVMEVQKAIDNVKTRLVELEKIKVKNIFDQQDIRDAKQSLEESKKLLESVKAEAYIKVQADTTEMIGKLTDAADKMHILRLEAQGLTVEAGKLKFDVANKGDIAAAEAFVAKLNRPVKIQLESDISKLLPLAGSKSIDDIFAPAITNPSAKALQAINPVIREIDKYRSTVEAARKGSIVDPRKLEEAYNFVDAYEKQVNYLKDASFVKGKAGEDEQLKITTESVKAEMEIRADAANYSHNLDEVRLSARYKAEKKSIDEINTLQKEARQIENRYTDGSPKSTEDIARLQQIQNVIELSKQGVQRAVDHAVEQFNKSATSGVDKTIKANYKDFERGITELTRLNKSALDDLDARYAQSKVSIFSYYKEKEALQLESINKQKTLYEQEIAFAGKSGDSTKIEELRDKIALLNIEIKQVPDLITPDKIKNIDEYNKSLTETAANYQELIGNYQEAERLRFGAIENPKIAKFQAVASDVNATAEQRAAAKVAMQQEQAIQANAGLSRQIAGIQTKITDINNVYSQKVQLLNVKLATGVESQWSGMLKLRDLNKERIDQLQQQADLQEKAVQHAKDLAAATSDVNEKDRQLTIAEKTQKQLDESKTNLESLKAEGDVVANHFQTVIGDAFQSSFEGLIMGTQTAKQAFTSFATSIVQDIAKIIASEIRSALLGKLLGFAGSAFGSFFGSNMGANGLYSPTTGKGIAGPNFGLANGGVMAGAGISAYSGSVVSTPTIFPFATGTGLMGEAGPEAILPLKRDSSGKLGVRTTGDKSGQSQGSVYNISVTVQGSKDDKPADTGQKIGDAIMRSIAKEEIYKAQRPGNMLNRTTTFG